MVQELVCSRGWVVVADIVYNYIGKTEYDCMGLVERVCELYDIKVPDFTTAKLQSIELSALKFGDIMAFDFHGKGADHLAFYLRDNTFVHHLDTTGVIISNIEHRYFKNRFKGIVIDG